METTLNKIRAHSPCTDGWKKLLAYLGKTAADDEPLSILTILESNGVEDAIWCLRAVDGQAGPIRLFAVWCARQCQHLLKDKRSLDALDVAERYAKGLATKEELKAACNAAYYAASSAVYNAVYNAACNAACNAVYNAACNAACNAAYYATYYAACYAACNAACYATRYAAYYATYDAACYAAYDAAYAAEDAATRQAQAQELRRICNELSHNAVPSK